MFNWTSLPALAALLVFWLLTLSVLTRSPRGLIPLAVVGAMVSGPLSLLGHSRQASALTRDEQWPYLLSLSALAAGMAVMAWNVATDTVGQESGVPF